MPSSDYLTLAKSLNSEASDRLLSRMTGKLPRRLDKDKLSQDDAIALQLELEDEQLSEWREKMNKFNAIA
ncbi:MAG: hypothetical protein D4R39_01120 [Methylophilaceae bacterium]|nr:MAG: hypothetical protein D4R39_01120 [Methylophilaceae bacterium]